jgi:hypothetical protein
MRWPRPQFRIRTILLLTTVVAAGLGWTVHLARWRSERAAFCRAQATFVQEHLGFLLSVSFITPQEEWIRLNEAEAQWKGLAEQYEAAIWRPWVRVVEPNPLPVWVVAEQSAKH